MKKVLSLILALAMVLSCVPIVFAEGEATADSYDLKDAFMVDTSGFKGTLATDYPNASLTPKNGANGNTGIWQVGYFPYTGTTAGAFDTLTTYKGLYRTAATSIAYGDATANATGRTPSLLYSSYTVKGDDTNGYYIAGVNAPNGSIGYNFSSGELNNNSATGNNSYSGTIQHQAAIFTAPKSGWVQPKLVLGAKSATSGILYRLDKVAADGTKTPVYPVSGETTYAIDPSGGTLTGTIPEYLASGWAMLSRSSAGLFTREEVAIYVAEGEQLVLRFACVDGTSNTGANQVFIVDTVQMNYVSKLSQELSSYYDANKRIIDLREKLADALSLSALPEDITFTLPTSLTAETTLGVFKVAEGFVDNTPTTLGVTYNGKTLNINLSLKALQETYDLGEAFALSSDFTTGTAANWYTETGNRKYPNDGTALWQVGRFHHNDSFATLTPATHLLPRGDKTTLVLTSRAKEDSSTANATLSTNMLWLNDPSDASPMQTADGAWFFPAVNTQLGLLGYSFGSNAFLDNSATGWSGDSNEAHQAAVFTVPADGIIKPYLKVEMNGASNAGKVAYRLDKVAKDGTRTVVLPAKDGVKITTTQTSDIILPDAFASGWGLVSGHAGSDWTIENDTYIRVEEGDKLELRFAPHGASSMVFCLDTYSLTYTSKIEKSATYEYKTGVNTIDLRETILEEMLLTALPEDATLTLSEDAKLTATDTAGVYTMDDDFVDGSVTLTVDAAGTTLVLDLDIKERQMVYDLAEAFALASDFTTGTAADWYTETGNRKYPNDGTANWQVGFFFHDDNFTTLTPAGYLLPKGSASTGAFTSRAKEDTTTANAALPAVMLWTLNKNVGDPSPKQTSDGAWYISGVNSQSGALGYSFSSGVYQPNSAHGWSGSNNESHKAAVFTAPRDGVILPYMKVAVAGTNAINQVAYRLDKVAKDGTRTIVFPVTGGKTITTTQTGDGIIFPEAFQSGWGLVTGYNGSSWTIEDNSVVRVEKGDKLELRFAPNGAASTEFCLDTYTLTYTEQFGEDDELLLASPLTPYEESYTVISSEGQIDLSQKITNPEAKGTVKYTVTDKAGVLRELAGSPGVYELTGELNVGGDAAIVRAGYYPSTDPETELYFTETKVYVNAASSLVDAFTAKKFLSTQLGYSTDGYILPYYTDVAERNLYGTIDMGIADIWKNAIVTFSANNIDADGNAKFEYLGNGRIRINGKHDYTDAGGRWEDRWNNDNKGTLTNSDPYLGSSNPAVRDSGTAGSAPVVLTIKATDGGVKSYNLWSFAATVQGDSSAETYNADAYSFDIANYYVASAVTRLEGLANYGDATEKFVPMYRDSADKSQISPVADDMYLHAQASSYWYPRVPSFATDGQIDFWSMSESGWKNKTNTEYVDYDGVAWTFVAPKDGTVKLSNHLPDSLKSSNGGNWITNEFTAEVRKYPLSGAAYTTLLSKTYNSGANPNAATATAGTMAEALETDGSLLIPVQKGDIIRIVLASQLDGFSNISSLKPYDGETRHLPDPTFTYASDNTGLSGGLIEAEIDTDVELVADGVLMMIYNAADELIEVVKGATSADVGYAEIEYETTEDKISYARLFFWDGLTNIQPLISDIIVRK